jgi:hypothetical protein
MEFLSKVRSLISRGGISSARTHRNEVELDTLRARFEIERDRLFKWARENNLNVLGDGSVERDGNLSVAVESIIKTITRYNAEVVRLLSEISDRKIESRRVLEDLKDLRGLFDALKVKVDQLQNITKSEVRVSKQSGAESDGLLIERQSGPSTDPLSSGVPLGGLVRREGYSGIPKIKILYEKTRMALNMVFATPAAEAIAGTFERFHLWGVGLFSPPLALDSILHRDGEATQGIVSPRRCILTVFVNIIQTTSE